MRDAQAAALWREQLDLAPAFYEERLHLLTGVMQPLWDRLPGSPRVVRTQTNKGERLLGRIVPLTRLAETLLRLGVQDSEHGAVTAEHAQRVLSGGGKIVLSNGWELESAKVGDERRLELRTGPLTESEGKQLQSQGMFMELIAWRERWFLPTAIQADILTWILRRQRVTHCYDKNAPTAASAARHFTTACT